MSRAGRPLEIVVAATHAATGPTPAPQQDVAPDDVHHTDRPTAVAGAVAVGVALRRGTVQMGPLRTVETLRRLNQVGGFDCMGCAWPDPEPGRRSPAEFCENGVKAVAEEATVRRLGPEFFAEHSVEELAGWSDYLLGQQGRLTHPMVLRPGDTHYRPIDWPAAVDLVASTLRGLDSPDEAIFYTSGRASNESAFAYQLFARAYGTNNLPDCSNMCHESTSVALAETIGIGKGSVTLQDIYDADLIVLAGQNPGTNHPRMLTALEKAKRSGARIIAVNPLPEAGLLKFDNPQTVRGISGVGTALADVFVPIRVNGDLALFQAIGAGLLEREDAAARRGAAGTVLDLDFIRRSTAGFDAWSRHVRALDWDAVEAATGLTRTEIERVTDEFARSRKTIVCWAMGLTQHRNAVATIKEIVNVILAQGNIGKPGAGLCPVRGHSNVQGDRTMGIWEKLPDHFGDALEAEFGFTPPSERGLDTVNAIRALRDGKAHVLVALGGNFAAATPDTTVTHDALRRARLTVHISTKLNRSHVVPGRTALILPTLGRTEADVTAAGPQSITVEDSMSSVHASRGRLEPAGPLLKSEIAITSEIAEATLAGGPRAGLIDWAAMRMDYSRIRAHISRVVPGCEAYDEKVARPGGFTLPHPPRDSRTFQTPSTKALFTVSPLEVLTVPDGHLLLQSIRSHDQFNTTIYGHDDRYRGLSGGREVVLVHPADLAELDLDEGDRVDLVAPWVDGSVRVVRGFRCVAYPTPRGCVAAYYPEVNPLIALDSTADGSNCPTSKSVVVRLTREGAIAHTVGAGLGVKEDGEKRSPVEPRHLS